MAGLDEKQLSALAKAAEDLARALAAAEEEGGGCIDPDQEVRVDLDDDPPPELIDEQVGVVGSGCWQLRRGPGPVIYQDRVTAHAELMIMLKIIRNAVTNLPEFGSVTVDDVPARGG